MDHSTDLASRKQIEKLVGENLFTREKFKGIDTDSSGNIDKEEFMNWARQHWVHDHVHDDSVRSRTDHMHGYSRQSMDSTDRVSSAFHM